MGKHEVRTGKVRARDQEADYWLQITCVVSDCTHMTWTNTLCQLSVTWLEMWAQSSGCSHLLNSACVGGACFHRRMAYKYLTSSFIDYIPESYGWKSDKALLPYQESHCLKRSLFLIDMYPNKHIDLFFCFFLMKAINILNTWIVNVHMLVFYTFSLLSSVVLVHTH